MFNIVVGRFVEDPQAQGVIRPEDDSWQLVIDKEGYPHLYIRVQIADTPEGHGLLCLEDMLPEGTTIPDLMKGKFDGELPPEEEQEAMKEYHASREKSGIPCPR